jgi:VWFA-related protein
MIKWAMALLAAMAMSIVALSQNRRARQSEDQTIRISTQLVQLDVVVTDKSGKAVRGLNKDDFELFENGKRQEIKFFEFVDATKGGNPETAGPNEAARQRSGPGLSAAEARRVFAFVIDDLTIRAVDLVYVRQMLANFVDNQMQPTDLVGIFRTVGSEGLLQQFTSDKAILHRAIDLLTPRTSAFGAFNEDQPTLPGGRPQQAGAVDQTANQGAMGVAGLDVVNQPTDINSTGNETNIALRSYMSLGSASFIVDSLKELPGRKSMVLVSGGLPVLAAQPNTVAGNVELWLNSLADQATRAGVAINTMDIRGLSAQVGVARFEDTPGNSALGMGNGSGFGRGVDEKMVGTRNPFDVTEAHMGLRQLAAATGGIAVLNRNDFSKGLESIVNSSDAYYLLAYSPADTNFKGEFRKVEIKARSGYKVLGRKGYVAREEPAAPDTAPTKEQQVLQAIKSPLARRDIYLDAVVVYKAAGDGNGAINIELLIDPNMLKFDDVNGKKQTNVDVAGFVFDYMGKLRGGFSKTLDGALTPEEFAKVQKFGFDYPADTEVRPGIYQIRLGVRDNKTGAIGTISRYIEVPDLSTGQFAASSLLLGAVPAGDTKAPSPTRIPGNRQISRKSDLRYATIIYNAKRKDGATRVTSQVTVSQNGKVLYKEAPQAAKGKDQSQLVALGQLVLAHVLPGRYVLTMVITDEQGDKKDRTLVRSMEFWVVD